MKLKPEKNSGLNGFEPMTTALITIYSIHPSPSTGHCTEIAEVMGLNPAIEVTELKTDIFCKALIRFP